MAVLWNMLDKLHLWVLLVVYVYMRYEIHCMREWVNEGAQLM